MTEKTAQQINRMKEQTIGVEVEMNNITRSTAAKTAATYFGTGRYEHTAYRNGYDTWSAWDAQDREWKGVILNQLIADKRTEGITSGSIGADAAKDELFMVKWDMIQKQVA